MAEQTTYFQMFGSNLRSLSSRKISQKSNSQYKTDKKENENPYLIELIIRNVNDLGHLRYCLSKSNFGYL